MSHSIQIGGFNHKIEYNHASLLKYLYFNYTVYVCEILFKICCAYLILRFGNKY